MGGGRNGMVWDSEAYMDDPSIISSLDVGLDLLSGQGWPLVTRFGGPGGGGAEQLLAAKQA